MDEKQIEKLIDEKIKKITAFTSRKITDTPTDDLELVNRKYVNLNGVTASRPTSSVIVQSYLDTTITKPIWYNGIGWIDATGTYV